MINVLGLELLAALERLSGHECEVVLLSAAKKAQRRHVSRVVKAECDDGRYTLTVCEFAIAAEYPQE